MNFAKKKYQVIKGAISKELADFAFKYLQISAEADWWMLNNGVTHEKNSLIGNFKIHKYLIPMLNMQIDLWKLY
jgi:hypothetical protein